MNYKNYLDDSGIECYFVQTIVQTIDDIEYIYIICKLFMYNFYE